MLSIFLSSICQVSSLSADEALLYAESFLLYNPDSSQARNQTFASLRFHANTNHQEMLQSGYDQLSNHTTRLQSMIDDIDRTEDSHRFSSDISMIRSGCISLHFVEYMTKSYEIGFTRFAKAAIHTAILTNRSSECLYDTLEISQFFERELIGLQAYVQKDSTALVNKECYIHRVNKAVIMFYSEKGPESESSGLLSLDVCLVRQSISYLEKSVHFVDARYASVIGGNMTDVTYPPRETYHGFVTHPLFELPKNLPTVDYAQVWFNVLSDIHLVERRVDLFGEIAWFTLSLEVNLNVSALSIAVGCNEAARVYTPSVPTRLGWRHVSISVEGQTAIVTLDEYTWRLELPPSSWCDCADAIRFYQRTNRHLRGRLPKRRLIFMGTNVLTRAWDGKQLENATVRFYGFTTSEKFNSPTELYPTKPYLIQLGNNKPVDCLTTDGFESQIGFSDCQSNLARSMPRVSHQPDDYVAEKPVIGGEDEGVDSTTEALENQDEGGSLDPSQESDLSEQLDLLKEANANYWLIMCSGLIAAVILFIVFAVSIIKYVHFASNKQRLQSSDASVQVSASDV